MVERDEFIQKTLMREFAEEALSKEFNFIAKVVNHKVYSIVSENNKFDTKFNKFFLNGVEVFVVD
jgi:hypothetical protein